MPDPVRLSIAGSLDQVAPLARAVRELCRGALDEEGVDALELSLVEAVNNVIRHGYGGEGGDLDVLVDARPGAVTLEIVDHARPMPPGLLEAAGPGRFAFDESDRDAIPEGGMGLALIRMSMDEVSYRAGVGENRLRLVRRARPAS